MKKMIKNIIDKILEFFKSIIDKIIAFFKLQKRETNIKIAAVVAALVLIIVVVVLALGKDNALFPDREWEGFFPHKGETATTTDSDVETIPSETTEDGIFDDSNIGEWDDIS